MADMTNISAALLFQRLNKDQGRPMGHNEVQEELNHTTLARYRLSERRAIIVHKYFLGIEMHYDPGIECAIQSWETRFAPSWRRERLMADCKDQLSAIEQYHKDLCNKLGRNISWEQAAHDWVARYALEWRQKHEVELTSLME